MIKPLTVNKTNCFTGMNCFTDISLLSILFKLRPNANVTMIIKYSLDNLMKKN